MGPQLYVLSSPGLFRAECRRFELGLYRWIFTSSIHLALYQFTLEIYLSVLHAGHIRPMKTGRIRKQVVPLLISINANIIMYKALTFSDF